MCGILILLTLLQSAAGSRAAPPAERPIRAEVLDAGGAPAAGAEIWLLLPEADFAPWIDGPDPALKGVAAAAGPDGKAQFRVKGNGPFGLFARSRATGKVSRLAWPLAAGDFCLLKLSLAPRTVAGSRFRLALPQMAGAVVAALDPPSAGGGPEGQLVPPELGEWIPAGASPADGPMRRLSGRLVGWRPARDAGDSLRLQLLIDRDSSPERAAAEVVVEPEAGGRFAALAPAGSVHAVLFGPRSWGRPVLFAEVHDADRDLGDIADLPRCDLDGIVRDDSGPVAGCTVLAAPPLAREVRPGDVYPCRFAVTDRAGRFALAGLSPGTWQLAALDSAGRRSFLSAAPKERLPVTLRFAPSASVAGRVADPLGEPAAGAEVYLYGTSAEDVLADRLGIAHRQCVTGADGRFLIGGLAPGSVYSIQVVLTRGTSVLGESVEGVRPATEDLEISVR